MSSYQVDSMHKIDRLPRYHKQNPFQDNDLSTFKLSNHLMMTFADKLTDDKRELVMRGNDLHRSMGRRLQNSDMPRLVVFLKMHPEVTSLDLAYNELTDEGLQTLAEYMLVYDQQILKLNVMCNNIRGRGVEKLAEHGANLALTSLRVNGNKMGERGGKALAQLLAGNPRLRHLDLGDTDQTIASFMYFTTALRWDRGSNDRLQILDLSRPLPPHNYQFDVGHFAEAVGQMLEYNTSIRELHLQKCGFSDHDMELLLLGLQWNDTLRLLDLGCNNLGCMAMKFLGEYLAKRPRLAVLMLAHNAIKDVGARTLSFAVPCSRVTLLDLSHNKLTDDGLLDILNSIKKPVKLRCLYVWGNTITHKSCWTLRRMLLSGVLLQDHLDVKVYHVDAVSHVAYNHVDRYTNTYYCVNECGYPPPRGVRAHGHKMAVETQRTVERHEDCLAPSSARECDSAHESPRSPLSHTLCGYGVQRIYKEERSVDDVKALLDEHFANLKLA